MPIEIHYRAKGLPALLSNAAHTPFVLDGLICGSVDGVIWGLKEPLSLLQRSTFTKWGPKARVPSTLAGNEHVLKGKVFWQGGRIVSGSQEHHEIIRRATFEKFRQDPHARLALLSTGDEALAYGQPEPDDQTSVPSDLLLKFLLANREEITSKFAIWMAKVITEFQEDGAGRDAEAYLWANRVDLGKLIAHSVWEQILKPVPAYVPGEMEKLNSDVRRAIIGMLTLLLEPGPTHECLRGGIKAKGLTFNEQIASDLAWTICAELRGYMV